MKDKKLNAIEAAIQHQINPNTLMKVGVNKELDMKFMVKRPVYGFEKMAKISSGAQVSGLKKGKFAIQAGFQMDINV